MATWVEPKNNYKAEDQVLPTIFNVLAENERYLKEVKITIEQVRDAVIAYTASGTRVNIASGDTIKTAFGKIQKWFADLGSLAFKSAIGTTDITNGAVTNDKIDTVAASKVTGLANVAKSGDYNDLLNKPNPSSGQYKRIVCDLDQYYSNFERGLFFAFMRLKNLGGFTCVTCFGVISTGYAENSTFSPASYAFSGDFGPCILEINRRGNDVSFGLMIAEDDKTYPYTRRYCEDSAQLILYKIADLAAIEEEFEDETI